MLTSLFPGLWLVAPESAPRYPYGNCLYVEDDVPALIDFGAGSVSLGEIPVNDIKMGFISHFHFDHLHCISLFPHIKLYCGQEEKDTYISQAAYIHFHGYDRWDELMPGVTREQYGNVVKLADDVPVNPGFREIPITGYFTEGQEFQFGNQRLVTMHLPGHTVGHYGFYFPQYNLLFSGDIDLAPTGPWYSSQSGNVESLKKSIRRIIELNPDIIVSSHRRLLKSNLRQQLEQYLQVVLDRENQIYDLLSHPQTLDSLAEHHFVFAGERNIYELFWEKMSIYNHMVSLCQQGLAAEIEPGYYQRK